MCFLGSRPVQLPRTDRCPAGAARGGYVAERSSGPGPGCYVSPARHCTLPPPPPPLASTSITPCDCRDPACPRPCRTTPSALRLLSSPQLCPQLRASRPHSAAWRPSQHDLRQPRPPPGVGQWGGRWCRRAPPCAARIGCPSAGRGSGTGGSGRAQR